MFLCAKTASAATAALGFGGYLLQMLGLQSMVVPVATAAIVALTAIVVMGIRRSNLATLFALVFFILAGLLQLWSKGAQPWLPFFRPATQGATWLGLLEATALMFVAFTGYARIAILGEEVREPERTISRAIIATLMVSGLLYIGVGAVGVATIGPEALAEAARSDVAPLVAAARTFDLPYAVWIVALGAVTAVLSVALNLILGLSRVVLAMGRRGDMPRALATVDESGSPRAAVIAAGVAIAVLTLIANVDVTWSFSAFTVLIYYAITNLAALRLPKEKQLYSPFLPGAPCGVPRPLPSLSSAKSGWSD